MVDRVRKLSRAQEILWQTQVKKSGGRKRKHENGLYCAMGGAFEIADAMLMQRGYYRYRWQDVPNTRKGTHRQCNREFPNTCE